MKRVRHRVAKGLRITALAFLVLLAVALVTHPGRVALKSGALLVEIFPDAPVYPLRLVTRAPARLAVSYTVADGTTTADVYRPAGDGRHGAFVFYIGIGPETRNPNVVRLSKALARAGVVVMVPVSPELSRFRVVPEEKEGVIAAFKYLSAQEYVDPDRVGIMGVSAGGSLVALGAADPRIANDVRLIELFGSYYDASSVVAAITVRSIDVSGQRVAWSPDDVPIKTFRDMILPTLPEADRPRLAPLFAGKVIQIPPGLSAEGRSVAELLINRDPARVPALLAALPATTKRTLQAISPSAEIDGLRTELFLLHDVDDAIIPHTESRAFYRAATQSRDRHLTEVQMFRHVEPTGIENPLVLTREGLKLYRHMFQILLRLT
ncbi:MAG: prolyl oligopeptidase family serine peptidase [Chloroflexia bacterium]|nr:prolyl oligopeptidase family serine peptidase [Chloroflexia bacterium]